VRLIDLLNAAKDKMKESLQARAEEGKSALAGEELEAAASIIGYGAVKYFDLKQHPSTNYVFSYERMLDTKGDTAVYLLFAYARLVSILRKVFVFETCFRGFVLSTVALSGQGGEED
jgi:arginyl-tRNA synthetase